MDITPYLGTIVTVLIAVGGVYAAISSRLTRLEALIETLTITVDRHNKVIERVYKLESDMATGFKRIDELRDNLLRIENKL